MFIGHNAVAFASKRLAPKTSLGILTAAVMLPDLIWPIFLLLGIEHAMIVPGATLITPINFTDYPWTHSLALTLAWGAAFAIVYWVISRYRRGALLVFLAVLSHWVLDFITHRPDLPLWPHGPRVGLGLWNSIWGTYIVEWGMFFAGVMIYRDSTKARDRIGSMAFWIFVAFLAALYLANAVTAPRNMRVVAYAGLGLWLFPIWAAWFDHHREATV